MAGNNNNESTMKWKVDIGQLTKAMQDAKRSIAVANAEFKTATAGMDKWSKSTDGLEAKIKQLNDTLPQQKKILADLEKQYELTAANMGEGSKQAHDLKIKIEEQRATIVKTETSINKYTGQLQDMAAAQQASETASGKLSKSIKEQQDRLDDMKSAYKDAVLLYGENSKEAISLAKQITELSGELAENKKKMQDADKAADDFDKSLDELDESANSAATGGFTVLKGALANLVSQGISAAVSGVKNLARETFNAGSNFEAGMSNVAAISGATAEELDKLSDKAKEMGSSTKFTATEAAEAFNYMAMAGWKTEDMIDGIAGIMHLAAASGADLATTSDIVTDALTAMGYSAGDAGKLADVMAAASSNANTNVELMGKTFQYAAPIIGALGYDMEDAAVAIGLMANAGIKGEKAGTALRSILTRLSAPPKECAEAMDELGISLTDSEGKMKGMDQVIDQLRDAFSEMSETEQTAAAKHIAGQEAMSGLLAIVRAAPDDYAKLTKAVENSSGAAATMADIMVDNVSGSITLLKSKIEGLMIKVYDKAAKSIKKSVETISKALDRVNWNKFAENAGKAAEKIADFFAYVVDHGPQIVAMFQAIATAFVTYKAVTTITSVVGAFKDLVAAVKGGKTIMEAFNITLKANPIALVAAAIAGLTVLIVQNVKAQKEAVEAQYGLNNAQKEAIEDAAALADSYKALDEARNEQIGQVEAEFGYINQLKDEYNSLIDSNGKVKEGYEDRANFILNQLAKSLGIEVDEIKKVIDANGKLGESIDAVIRKKQAEATLAAGESAYTDAIKNRSKALETLTTAQKTFDEAEKKYQETQKQSQDIWEEYYRLLTEDGWEAAGAYYQANKLILDGNTEAKKSYDEAKKGVEDAEQAWIGYNSTIQNYEGLSAAIISGDTEKINSAMQNMVNNFITAETGNRESLERQVENYKLNLKNLEDAIKNGTPSVTQDMVDQAKSMVDAANAELDKLPPEAAAKGTEAGSSFAEGIGGKQRFVAEKAEGIANQAETSITPAIDKLETKGDLAGAAFGAAVGSQTNKNEAKKSAEELADKAVEGADSEGGDKGGAKKSGSNFGEGFFNGIGSWFTRVWEKAKNLAKSALGGLKEGQEEGSPSKLTAKSGQFFGEGYLLGIEKMMNPVALAAADLAKSAVDALGDNLSDQMRAIGVDGGNSLLDGMDSVLPDMSDSIGNLKASVASANTTMLGDIGGTNVGSFAAGGQNIQNVTFNQYNNSPQALDRLSIYRETNSLLFSAKVRLNNV